MPMNDGDRQFLRSVASELELLGLQAHMGRRRGTRDRIDGIQLPLEPEAVVVARIGDAVESPLFAAHTSPSTAELRSILGAAGSGQGRIFGAITVYLVVPRLRPDVRADLGNSEDTVVVEIDGADPREAARRIADHYSGQRRSKGLPERIAPEVARSRVNPELRAVLGRLRDRLRGSLAEDRFRVLLGEVEGLVAEFDAGHFTACALRAGRALEHVVYSLAIAWRVEIDEPALRLLDQLERMARSTHRAVYDYRACDPAAASDRVRERERVRNEVNQMVQLLTNTTCWLDDPDRLVGKEGDRGPRPVEAILRDVRRRFGPDPVIRRLLDSLIEGDQAVRRVLNVRNAAAHASADGTCQEASFEQIEAMLIDMEHVIDVLAQVADAVERSGR